jgi:hypothetical protein
MLESLRKAQIVNQEKRARPRADEILEFRVDRLQVIVALVEPTGESSLDEHLDFGSVVIRRYEHLISGIQLHLS